HGGVGHRGGRGPGRAGRDLPPALPAAVHQRLDGHGCGPARARDRGPVPARLRNRLRPGRRPHGRRRRPLPGLGDAGDPGGLHSRGTPGPRVRRWTDRPVGGDDAHDERPSGHAGAPRPVRWLDRRRGRPLAPPVPREAARRGARPGEPTPPESARGRTPKGAAPAHCISERGTQAATTSMLTLASTSGCRRTDVSWAPSVLIGAPSSMRRLSTSGPPAALIAEAMSAGVTEPKRRPASPERTARRTLTPSSCALTWLACSMVWISWILRARRICSTSFSPPLVQRIASFRGTR